MSSPNEPPVFTDLDALVSACGDQHYAHPLYGGDGCGLDPRSTAARVSIAGRWWIVHADTWVSRLRDLAAHLAAGGDLVLVDTSTSVGLTERDDRKKDHLYVYLDDKPDAGARPTAPPTFTCPGCYTIRPIGQRTAGGVCADCAD